MASKSLFFVALLVGSLGFTSVVSVANMKLKSGLEDQKTFFHHHGGLGGGRGLGEGAAGGGAGGGYGGGDTGGEIEDGAGAEGRCVRAGGFEGISGGSWFGGGAGSDINGRCRGGLP